MRENWGRACSGASKSQPHGQVGSSSWPPSQVAVLIKAAPTQKAHGFALGPRKFSLEEPIASTLSTFCPAS